MIQKINPTNFLKIGALAVFLASAAGCTSTINNNPKEERKQQTELLSKAASDSIKANYIANLELNSNKRIDEFDSAGRPLKEYQYNNIGCLESEAIYKYRPDGKYTKYTQYSDGVKWFQSFDANDRIHQAIVYDSNDNVDLQYVYAYAPDGTQREIIYDGKGRVLEN